VDINSGIFFKNARRSGLWPKATAVHRSAVTKARSKISWTIFQDLLGDAVKVAYQCWPQDQKYLWHDMSVFAFDGSKYTLPATKEIRTEFDPKSGLQNNGKGHFPQCLVMTAYDVFRRLPIARSIEPIHASERYEAKKLLPFIPSNSVSLFDRGFPAYGFIKELQENLNGYFIIRCPAKSTFPAVEKFIKSNRKEDIIYLKPTHNCLLKLNAEQRKQLRPLKIRVIKLTSPDGTLSVLLTNLFDRKQYSCREIIDLYFRRWAIEGFYRDEKIVFEVEKFHGQTCNSIRQELFAAAIMSVISRTMMALSSELMDKGGKEPQFKNAIITLAAEAAFLVPEDPKKAVKIFKEILHDILRVKYYPPKQPRPSMPRVTKKAINKWSTSKLKKTGNA
jgi:hypothetical protein